MHVQTPTKKYRFCASFVVLCGKHKTKVYQLVACV